MKRFIHHICIQTNDYSASKHFYETLGFTLAKETQGFHLRDYNSWLKMDHFYIELQTAKQGELLRDFSKHSAGPVHFCLYIEDLEKEVSRLQVLGVPFAKKMAKYCMMSKEVILQKWSHQKARLSNYVIHFNKKRGRRISCAASPFFINGVIV